MGDCDFLLISGVGVLEYWSNGKKAGYLFTTRQYSRISGPADS